MKNRVSLNHVPPVPLGIHIGIVLLSPPLPENLREMTNAKTRNGIKLPSA